MNPYDMMTEGLREAMNVMRAADNKADDLAEILQGRLRKVSNYNLTKLKREISRFNSRTGKWKEGK